MMDIPGKIKRIYQRGNGPASEGNNAGRISTLSRDPKNAVENYLAHYVAQDKPGYAVLVSGEWGVGKTYQVRDVLPSTHAYYVSLYGLNSPDEITSSVFAAMFPNKAKIKDAAAKVGSVSATYPGVGSIALNGIASVLVNTLIKSTVDADRPLILDDLERSTVSPKTVLGIVNRYVEHNGCRVIVIAHDEKIIDDIRDYKEKIFGQTLKIDPQLDNVFEIFYEQYRSMYDYDIMAPFKKDIIGIYRESGIQSLRILKHVIEDSWRLISVLDKKYLQNSIAITELIRLFCAISSEYRYGTLLEDDLRERAGATLSYRLNNRGSDGQDVPKFVLIKEKYKSIDLESNILSDEVLISTIVGGNFNWATIKQSLDFSGYYTNKEAPAWLVVISFDKVEQEKVNEAVNKLKEQFERRTINDPSEILHMVAALMMMLVADEQFSKIEPLKKKAKKYIDDLLKSNALPPRPSGHSWERTDETGAYGFGYWVQDEYREAFEDVRKHLIKARIKALDHILPTKVPHLLETLEADGEAFFSKVCYSNSGTIEFEDIPILIHVKPSDFVSTWMKSPTAGWYWIAHALKERRDASSRYPALSKEAAWIELVAREMLAVANNSEGLAKYRIIRCIKQFAKLPSPPTARANTNTPPKSAPARRRRH